MSGKQRTITIPVMDPEQMPDGEPSPRWEPSPRKREPEDTWEKSPQSQPGLTALFSTSSSSVELIKDKQAVYEQLKDLPRISELDYKPTAKFVESTSKSVLDPLIKRANCIMVAGGFFGDEGKGKTVDGVAGNPLVKMVARVNSGENAGHTVVSEAGVKYAFNLCPSGLLVPGKVNAIGPECVMDPVSFMEKEISQLLRDGVEYKDRLFVGDVHLVCPHHKLLDLMNSWKNPNASTIMGMAPVHASKSKRKGLRMDHLFNDREEARRRLDADLFDYFGCLKQLGITEDDLYEKAKTNPKVQAHVLEFIKAEDKAAYLFDLYDKHVINNPNFPERADISHMLRTTISEGGKVLLEGPQSYWLSNASEKFWDSGTSANTCASGMLAASRLNLSGLRVVVINIHKTPGSSRVGSGANPVSFVPQDFWSKTGSTKFDFDAMELDWRDVSKNFFDSVQPNGIIAPQIYSNSTGSYDLGVAMAAATCVHPSHGEFGVTSGRPRVVGFFDCVAQAEMMAAQGPYCSISALDRGDDYDDYGVCIAYVFQHPEGKSMVSNGKTFESGTIIKAGDQLPTQPILRYCQPIIMKVKGWRDTPLYAKSTWWTERKAPVDMPDAVCDLLDIIEHFTGSKIISIGNGPKGHEIIYIKRKTEKKPKAKAKAKTKAKAKPEAKAKTEAKAKPKAKAKATSVAERRVDPEDGVAYTFEELAAFYMGKYKKKAIEAYWETECAAPKAKAKAKTKSKAKAKAKK